MSKDGKTDSKQQAFKQIKLQIPAGKASPAPPVGPALGQAGVNIMDFCKQFNDATKHLQEGLVVPVIINVDTKSRAFTFILKQPPASVLIMKVKGIDKGSARPNQVKIGDITDEELEEVAKQKMPDLNVKEGDIEAAKKIIAGSAKSMGLIVKSKSE